MGRLENKCWGYVGYISPVTWVLSVIIFFDLIDRK